MNAFSLHWEMPGERLCVGGPGHSHRLRAGYIAKDDWRLDTPTAVGLHPAVAREGVPIQLLPEVLHHVISLSFPMHEHIQSQLMPSDCFHLV